MYSNILKCIKSERAYRKEVKSRPHSKGGKIGRRSHIKTIIRNTRSLYGGIFLKYGIIKLAKEGPRTLIAIYGNGPNRLKHTNRKNHILGRRYPNINTHIISCIQSTALAPQLMVSTLVNMFSPFLYQFSKCYISTNNLGRSSSMSTWHNL